MTKLSTTSAKFYARAAAGLSAAGGIFFFRTLPAVAAGWGIVNPQLQKRIKTTKLGESSPVEVALLITQTLLNLLALFTVALIVYAGFRWMLSRGNEEEIAKAKGLLVGAVLGLLVILASLGILNYVFTTVENITGVETTSP